MQKITSSSLMDSPSQYKDLKSKSYCTSQKSNPASTRKPISKCQVRPIYTKKVYSNKPIIKLLFAKFEDVPERPYLQQMSNTTLGVQWLENAIWKHIVIRPILEALHVHQDNGKGPAHEDNVSFQDEGDLEKMWKASDNYPEIHVHRWPESWSNSTYKSPHDLAKLLSPDIARLLSADKVRTSMVASVRGGFKLDTSPLLEMMKSFLDGTFTTKHDCKQCDLQHCKYTCQDVCRIPSQLSIPRELVACYVNNSLKRNLNRPLGTSVEYHLDECCEFAKELSFKVKEFLTRHDLLKDYRFEVESIYTKYGKYGNILMNAFEALGDLSTDPLANALRNNIRDWISEKDTTNSGIDFKLGDITILGSGRIVSNSTGSFNFKDILKKIGDLPGVTQSFKDVLIMASIAFVSSRCIAFLGYN